MGSDFEPRRLKRAVIKEELVELTGDHLSALLLNQLLYWTERMRDVDAYIAEEKRRSPATTIPLTHGWIYKSTDEMSEEIMVAMSGQSLRRRITALVGLGLIEERNNPDHPYDRTLQYRVNYGVIQRELLRLGYSLEGYAVFGVFPTAGVGLGLARPSSNLEDAFSRVATPSSNLENGSSNLEIGSSRLEIVKGNTEITPEITADTTAAAETRVREGAAGGVAASGGGGGSKSLGNRLVGRLTSEARLRPRQASAVVTSGLVASDADVDRCVAFVQSSDAAKPAAVLWSEWLSQGVLPPAPEAVSNGRPTDGMSEAEIVAYYERMEETRYHRSAS